MAKINATKMEMLGVKVYLSMSLIAFKIIRQYKKVAKYWPSTIWFRRLYIKFCKSLGPYCEEANCSTTRVMEKTVPATPIIAPAIVANVALPELAFSVNTKFRTPTVLNG